VLFNSYAFIFLFLPITLLGFHLIGGRGHHRIAIAWLVAASLFFYGWWNPAYLGLILGSMLFNYAVGVSLSGNPNRGVLGLGIAANLGLLGYYKYANFFVDNLNAFVGSSFHLETILLPLAISFFTFQQIAYLVDAYRGETHEYRFLHYALFVTFFPQLIAGPIVHHKEMLPQFAKDVLYRLKAEHLAVGITIFAIGLFKKVVLADGIAVYATPVFDAAEAGVALTFFEAWGGALAYTLQLYFDFSGYSDMAIGLARMFGVRLPLNFNSPYKATNIIDFWRRWHITLSRFLRDYLYIPLGGNRKGEVRRNINILITMLLGGLWHGAGWTFVLWGGLHGAYLVINHAWRRLFQNAQPTLFGSFFGWTITMLAVVAAWVPFRAESMEGAMQVLGAMAGSNGFALPESYLGYLNKLAGLGNLLATQGWQFGEVEYFKGIKQVSGLVLLILLAALSPNTQQIMNRHRPAFETYRGEIPSLRYRWMEWQPNRAWGFILGIIFLLCLIGLSKPSEFLYFQF
jgi:alginate O-acetyltransferase complex protein AlgI